MDNGWGCGPERDTNGTYPLLLLGEGDGLFVLGGQLLHLLHVLLLALLLRCLPRLLNFPLHIGHGSGHCCLLVLFKVLLQLCGHKRAAVTHVLAIALC